MIWVAENLHREIGRDRVLTTSRVHFYKVFCSGLWDKLMLVQDCTWIRVSSVARRDASREQENAISDFRKQMLRDESKVDSNVAVALKAKVG